MAAGRPMLALHIAEATGAMQTNPARFKDRAIPENDPLGAPEDGMTSRECELWREMLARMWWLREHHRYSFAIMVRVYAVLETGKLEIKLLNAYAKYAAMLGADARNDSRFGKQEKPSSGASEFTGR